MSETVESLKRYLSERLALGSSAYLGPALLRFHAAPSDDAEAQAVIGNLSIGVDLLVKACLASLNPALIFKDLPFEAKAYFYAPDEAPRKFNLKPLELDVRDFAYKIIPFEEAVRTFFVFFPEARQLLRPYFKNMAELKDLAAGASPGRVEKHELLKCAYLAVGLADLMNAKKKIHSGVYPLTEADRRFVRDYTVARAGKTSEKLRAAKEKASGLKLDITFNDPAPAAGWDSFETRCPVCKNWAFLTGWTDIRCEEDGPHEWLEFYADSFECDACGLLLEDVEEMRLGGVAPTYDRSEDLARWRDDGAEKKSVAD